MAVRFASQTWTNGNRFSGPVFRFSGNVVEGSIVTRPDCAAQ
ncbi:Hypothetical protein RY70_714 [Bifidobacterium bifidum]|uniref:Uncharacterized protein n=1 Tax=Bifidobacterium bifidum TaxID=1681 RepID=A0A0M4MKA3_BIFBI|nr:Hypothetical protein RY70_714 [Bifidobacterium bifidum]KWZ82037.1 hypothetical protein HMPREF3196_00620 [Bifidobacterium bifidum]